STWGWKGYFEYWLNGSVDYMYRHLHVNTKTFFDLLKSKREEIENNELSKMLVETGISELLQAQCSDWPFIVFTGQVSQYGHQRFKEHILNILKISENLGKNDYDIIEKPEFIKAKEISKIYNIDFAQIRSIIYEKG
ncbi:MAG: 1,4-alpha-glucan branching protein domain-containing protein, partial [bacterium]